MRHIHSALLSLGLLSCSVGVVAAQNVCVRAADGAIVCGPVTERNFSPSQNPFDQPPRPNFTEPTERASPAPEPGPLSQPTVRDANRDIRPPQSAYRALPPRTLDEPPPRQTAREDARQNHSMRDHRPPRSVDRERPVHYSNAERRRYEERREVTPQHIDRNIDMRQYDRRLRELEREVRLLRASRYEAARRDDNRRTHYREPPPRSKRELSRREREREAALRRAYR